MCVDNVESEFVHGNVYFEQNNKNISFIGKYICFLISAELNAKQ